ncbi:MAG: GerAB/ArcD/ProY family transporter, partial [Candidatus Pacearchaeota archaeon]|nr:GerAB/ArcD/ProY family transporter [Candidatus Pacearchaeota archaeon]
LYMEKALLAAIATLVGTTIGAGILALPYAFAKAGLIPGVLQLVLVGIAVLFVNLSLGEVILRTKEKHQLPGYAEKYLGKWGKFLLLVSCFVFIYGALTAYVIGEGEVLSFVFLNTTDFRIFFALGFFIVMAFFLYSGLEALEKGELIGLFVIMAMIFIIFLFFLPKIDLRNFSFFAKEKFLWFFPYGIVMFAFLAFSALPEMREELYTHEKLFKHAIVIGTLIPLILYFLFSFAVYGFAGKKTPEIATIALGKLPCILAIFTMFSAFFALGIALKEIFVYDLKLKHIIAFLLVVLPVFFLAFSIMLFGLVTFSKILSFVGSISGGIGGILIVLMAKRAKLFGNRKPEYSLPLNLPIVLILIILFVLGIAYQFFF